MENVRKKSKELLSHVIPIRISDAKLVEYKSLLDSSRCRSMSELLRKIIDNRKIIIETVDGSRQQVMEELALIRKEIHAIGVNINQATRAINAEKQPKAQVLQALEITRLFQQADQRIATLFDIMAKLSEQ